MMAWELWDAEGNELPPQPAAKASAAKAPAAKVQAKREVETRRERELCLLRAAGAGRVNELQAEGGAQVLPLRVNGESCLHAAAMRGQTQVLLWLAQCYWEQGEQQHASQRHHRRRAQEAEGTPPQFEMCDAVPQPHMGLNGGGGEYTIGGNNDPAGPETKQAVEDDTGGLFERGRDGQHVFHVLAAEGHLDAFQQLIEFVSHHQSLLPQSMRSLPPAEKHAQPLSAEQRGVSGTVSSEHARAVSYFMLQTAAEGPTASQQQGKEGAEGTNRSAADDDNTVDGGARAGDHEDKWQLGEVLPHGVHEMALGPDARGHTPLHYAAWHGHAKIVEFLLCDCGMNPSCRTNEGVTPLQFASMGNHLQCVELISFCVQSEAEAREFEEHQRQRRETRQFAIDSMQEEADMLDRGAREQDARVEARVRSSCNGGRDEMPSMSSVVSSHLRGDGVRGDANGAGPETGEEKGHGATATATSMNGSVHWQASSTGVNGQATGRGRKSEEDGTDEEGVVEDEEGSADSQSSEEMRDQHGTVLERASDSGQTALHKAAFAGSTETVRFLIESNIYRADVRTPTGLTPLHFSAMGGHYATSRYLVSRDDVSVDVCGIERQTPLHKAADAGHANVVDLLLSVGADMDAVDREGRTATHLAAAAGSVGSTAVLTAWDMAPYHVETYDSSGLTPMDYAVDGEFDAVASVMARTQYIMNRADALEAMYLDVDLR